MRYKKYRACRSFKGCSPLQLSCDLIGNRPQLATFYSATVYAKRRRPFVGKLLRKPKAMGSSQSTEIC